VEGGFKCEQRKTEAEMIKICFKTGEKVDDIRMKSSFWGAAHYKPINKGRIKADFRKFGITSWQVWISACIYTLPTDDMLKIVLWDSSVQRRLKCIKMEQGEQSGSFICNLAEA
jgi:hypothetical protein